MKCTVIDFIDYKKQQIHEINLDTLKNTHLCLLASLIADELLIIDKQLSYLQLNNDNLIQNEYNSLNKVNEYLINVIEKINRHVRDKSCSFQVNFYEFHSIFKIIDSNWSNSLLAKKVTSESKRLCALHEALEPIYNKNKAILKQLEVNEVL